MNKMKMLKRFNGAVKAMKGTAAMISLLMNNWMFHHYKDWKVKVWSKSGFPAVNERYREEDKKQQKGDMLCCRLLRLLNTIAIQQTCYFICNICTLLHLIKLCKIKSNMHLLTQHLGSCQLDRHLKRIHSWQRHHCDRRNSPKVFAISLLRIWIQLQQSMV